jgi:hypothetical protein
MTDSEDINTLLRQILDELIAMRTESERRSKDRKLESKLRGERAKAIAESQPLVVESRLALRELVGEDYVPPPPSDNPLQDAIRMLAVSRAMLEEMLAEESLEDPLTD